jgi:hypothetical protein
MNILFAVTNYTRIDRICCFINLPSRLTYMNRNIITPLIDIHMMCLRIRRCVVVQQLWY